MGVWRAWLPWLIVVVVIVVHSRQDSNHRQLSDKPLRHLAIYRHSRTRHTSAPSSVLKDSPKTLDAVVHLVHTGKQGRKELKNSTSARQKSDIFSPKVHKRSPPTEECGADPPPVKPPKNDSTVDRVIDVAVIVPCNASHQYSRVKVLPVVELAVRHLRETGLRGPLQNYTINVTYRDSRTSSTFGPLAAVDLYFNNSAGKLITPFLIV
nr:uncharacterized protein LOC123752078 [Procambarus clarkii]